MHSVDAKAKMAKIEDHQENAISARKKMFELSFNNGVSSSLACVIYNLVARIQDNMS